MPAFSPSNNLFPLTISPNRRYLVNRNNQPFLIHGDTAWSLITGISEVEADSYLANRAAKGFNAIIVNLIEHKFNGPMTRTGLHPFTNSQDLGKPNEAYFDYAERILRKAADYGIVVFLCAMYLGFKHARNDDGWFQEARLSGCQGCFDYGQFIGRRFAGLKNIVWMMGGDRNPDGVVDEVTSLVRGIKAGDPDSLFTAHPHPDAVTIEQYGGTSQGGWLDISTTYGYQILHSQVSRDYQARPVLPFVMVESTYEGEHNSSPVQIRRQAYWSILGGACGQFMGNNPIWLFNPGWQSAMDLEGSQSMAYLKRFFASRAWQTLIPDDRVEGDWTSSHTHFILAGNGEFRGLDTLTAACTADKNTLMAYMPSRREVTVDLRRMAGSFVRAWWFNPRNGEGIPAGEYPTTSPQSFLPPAEGDWGLVIDNAGLNLPAPGI
jgi:hypothetical protein